MFGSYSTLEAFNLLVENKVWSRHASNRFNTIVDNLSSSFLASVDEKIGESKMTLLHCAAKMDNSIAVKKLISVGASLDARDSFNHTPLDYAVFNNSTSLVKLLSGNCVDELNAARSELKMTRSDLETTRMNLHEESRKRQRAEDDLVSVRTENVSLKRRKVELENENLKLRTDNTTLSTLNREIGNERDTFKKRYETLKKSMKK